MSLSAVFTEWSKATLTTANWTTSGLRLTIFERAPYFGDDDIPGNIANISTLTDLLATDGWQAVTGSHANDGTAVKPPGVPVQTDASGNKYVGSAVPFTYFSDGAIFAKAFALSIEAGPLDDFLICVFQPERPIYMSGTTENPSYIKASSPIGMGSITPYLFSYTNNTDDSSPSIGPVGIAVPSLKWEGPRSAHVWPMPQRVNYVVNASFESNGDDGKPWGWRSNSTMTRETGGLNKGAGDLRTKCGKLAGSQTTKVIESTFFPTSLAKEWWSVEAAVAGTGLVRVGIVFYPPDMDPAGAFYEATDWETVSSDGTSQQGQFKIIKGLIHQPETVSEAVFRIEFQPSVPTGACFIDNCLADPNEAQLGFFDGQWEFGQRFDYGWYTGTGVQEVNDPHRTFSTFYPNRRALQSYLFDVVDDRNRHQALSWVPEGAGVIPHWDDVYSSRLHSWLDDVYIPTLDYVTKNTVTTLS